MRNTAFKWLALFGAVFMVICAVISAVDAAQNGKDLLPKGVAAGVFMLSGLFFLRISIQLRTRHIERAGRSKT
jgi:hypothetical protein